MRAARRPLVLVVDDGRQHVTLLRLALMERGFSVVVVFSAEGAHTMVREKPIDAVLMTLPLDAAAGILRDFGEARPHVAVALVAAADGARDAAVAAGFDVALSRPIDFGELDAVLRERMTRRRSGTRARAKTATVVDAAANDAGAARARSRGPRARGARGD